MNSMPDWKPEVILARYFHEYFMGNFALYSEEKKCWIVVGLHSEWGKSGKELVLVGESEARIKAEKKPKK